MYRGVTSEIIGHLIFPASGHDSWVSIFIDSRRVSKNLVQMSGRFAFLEKNSHNYASKSHIYYLR